MGLVTGWDALGSVVDCEDCRRSYPALCRDHALRVMLVTAAGESGGAS